MDLCHICFDKKNTKEKEVYCSRCSPFICSECLLIWRKENKTCPICKKEKKEVSIVIVVDEDTESSSDEDITDSIEDDYECNGCCILKRAILIYLILTICGFIHFISMAAYEGDDVIKMTTFYIKEPISYVICPLLGGYILLVIFSIVVPCVYVCSPCFRSTNGRQGH